MSAEYPTKLQQTTNNPTTHQQSKLLKMLSYQIKQLRSKMCNYGISSAQFKQNMQNNLSHVWEMHMDKNTKERKNRQRNKQKQQVNSESQSSQHQKQKQVNSTKNLNRIIAEITKFVSKKPSRSIQLIKDIMKSIEQRIHQFESQSSYDEKLQKIKSNGKSNLKIEGIRGQFQSVSGLENESKGKISTNQSQGIGYVKFEYIKEADWEQNSSISISISPPAPNRKRKGGRSGSKNRKGQYKFQ